MQRIIKGDMVVVISGKNRGLKGNVLKVINDNKVSKKVVVSGVNVCVKHKKATAASAGGLTQKEFPIDVSNIALFCKHTNKPSKVGVKCLENGQRVRIYKKSKECVE